MGSPRILGINLFQRAWTVTIVLFSCIFFAISGSAQEQREPHGNDMPSSSCTSDPKREEETRLQQKNGTRDSELQAEHTRTSAQRGSWVIAPLPISSPALGTGIVPVFGYIFPLRRRDTASPPSVFGMAGLVTNNGSRGFGAYTDLYFQENTYRATAIYFRGNLNYDLFGTGVTAGNSGQKLPLEQSGQVFRGEMLRRFRWDLFLGVRLWNGKSEVVLRSQNLTTLHPEPPPDIGLWTVLRALGLHLHRETTANRFYPVDGTLLDLTADFFSHALGSKYSFQSYRFTFDQYASLDDNQVLAYDLFVCGTGGRPPFYGNCIYGTNNQLRGYTAGRYLDRYMFTTQLEYRLSLPKRFGVVAFGGIGEVVPGGTQVLRINNFLPSAGGGLRFQLSGAYHVNLRSDFARGKDTWTWSMGVGEAF